MQIDGIYKIGLSSNIDKESLINALLFREYKIPCKIILKDDSLQINTNAILGDLFPKENMSFYGGVYFEENDKESIDKLYNYFKNDKLEFLDDYSCYLSYINNELVIEINSYNPPLEDNNLSKSYPIHIYNYLNKTLLEKLTLKSKSGFFTIHPDYRDRLAFNYVIPAGISNYSSVFLGARKYEGSSIIVGEINDKNLFAYFKENEADLFYNYKFELSSVINNHTELMHINVIKREEYQRDNVVGYEDMDEEIPF